MKGTVTFGLNIPLHSDSSFYFTIRILNVLVWTTLALILLVFVHVIRIYLLFDNNIYGDDYLNIVRSDFSITDSHFRNVNADAFDSDFSTGFMKEVVFDNIGNDGIDISGTRLKIEDITMSYVGDKGISSGEKSDDSGYSTPKTTEALDNVMKRRSNTTQREGCVAPAAGRREAKGCFASRRIRISRCQGERWRYI